MRYIGNERRTRERAAIWFIAPSRRRGRERERKRTITRDDFSRVVSKYTCTHATLTPAPVLARERDGRNFKNPGTVIVQSGRVWRRSGKKSTAKRDRVLCTYLAGTGFHSFHSSLIDRSHIQHRGWYLDWHFFLLPRARYTGKHVFFSAWFRAVWRHIGTTRSPLHKLLWITIINSVRESKGGERDSRVNFYIRTNSRALTFR